MEGDQNVVGTMVSGKDAEVATTALGKATEVAKAMVVATNVTLEAVEVSS